MKAYSTTQRQHLIAFFEQHPDRQFTVDDITQAVCAQQNISRSAVYRNIAQMMQQGAVRRFQQEQGRGFVYQYVACEPCKNHLHARCQVCGQTFHLDDSVCAALTAALQKNSCFTINKEKTLLIGRCSACT